MPNTTFDARLLFAAALERVATDPSGDTYAVLGDRSVLVFNRNFPLLPGRDSGPLGARPVSVAFAGGTVWVALDSGRLVQLLLVDPGDGFGLTLEDQVGLTYRINSAGAVLRNSVGADRAIVGEVEGGGVSVDTFAANPLVAAGPSGILLATVKGAGVAAIDATTGAVLAELHGFLTNVAGLAYASNRAYAADGRGRIAALSCSAAGALALVDRFENLVDGMVNPDLRVVQGTLAACSRQTGRVTFFSLANPDAPVVSAVRDYHLDPDDPEPVTVLDQTGSLDVRSLDRAFLDFITVPVLAAREHGTTSRVLLHSGGISYPGNARSVGRFTKPGLGSVFFGGPVDATVVEGGNATFTVTYSGFVNPTFQWQYWTGSVWANLSGETRPVLVVFGALRALNGRQYRCAVTDSAGTVYSNQAVLTVHYAPSGVSVSFATDIGGYQFIGKLYTFTATVATQGSPAGIGQWQINNGAGWVDIPGQTGLTYVHTPLASDKSATFRYVVTNVVGSAASSSATPTVRLFFGYTSPDLGGGLSYIAMPSNIAGPVMGVARGQTPPQRSTYTVGGVDVGAMGTPAVDAAMPGLYVKASSGAFPNTAASLAVFWESASSSITVEYTARIIHADNSETDIGTFSHTVPSYSSSSWALSLSGITLLPGDRVTAFARITSGTCVNPKFNGWLTVDTNP